ncbi:hypothetical protein [Methylomonas methanica]|nr:hypothetical protein [Methylomonas methanica]
MLTVPTSLSQSFESRLSLRNAGVFLSSALDVKYKNAAKEFA